MTNVLRDKRPNATKVIKTNVLRDKRTKDKPTKDKRTKGTKVLKVHLLSKT